MAKHRPIGRLVRDEDFRRVYREGIRHTTALLVIHALPNHLNTVRLGVVVGRRFGRAAVRNRLRRRLREAVRAHVARSAAGADLVVVPRTAAVGAPFAALRAAAGDALGAVLTPTRGGQGAW